MSPTQSEIEERLAAEEPEVEVLLAEVSSGRTLRIYIDHPDGVTLALCERVTALLSDLRERYALEVSSPGSERPLTKPTHFRRFVGRRARVRTRWPATGSAGGPIEDRPADRSRSRPADRSRSVSSAGTETRPAKSFTGELVGATDSEITLAADGGVVAIPYSEIRRSNLVEE